MSDIWLAGHQKMLEYQDNGCRLGWLIDPKNKRVGIDRPRQVVEILPAPDQLFGENVLPGFVLDAQFLWV